MDDRREPGDRLDAQPARRAVGRPARAERRPLAALQLLRPRRPVHAAAAGLRRRPVRDPHDQRRATASTRCTSTGTASALENRYADPANRASSAARPLDTIHYGISERFSLIAKGGAGGPLAVPGDYLYMNAIGRRFRQGAWGIIRVLPGRTANLQPLPDRAAPASTLRAAGSDRRTAAGARGSGQPVPGPGAAAVVRHQRGGRPEERVRQPAARGLRADQHRHARREEDGSCPSRSCCTSRPASASRCTSRTAAPCAHRSTRACSRPRPTATPRTAPPRAASTWASGPSRRWRREAAATTACTRTRPSSARR